MKYRSEIDGLRAVAVVPVILFHAGLDLFSGGFVGVDVFFVISGYLITTIIINELDRGNFSLGQFYERRVRRILPVLFLVMLVSIPIAWIVLLPQDMKDFGQSIVSVVVFSSNFLFWIESGYFETAAELKPLLHTWSLAVEEQFYIFFPLFLMAAWGKGRKWIIMVLAMVCLLSLGAAHWAAYNKPDAAFYLLPFRGWELLLGSFAALYLQKRGLPDNSALGNLTSLTGLLMVIASVFLYDNSTPFPSFYALLPTVGTVLLILFATRGTIAHTCLSFKPVVAIGLISYSAYLWHQPLFAFARHQIYLSVSETTFLFLAFLCLPLSYLSWRYVEQPFRGKTGVSKRGLAIFLVPTCVGLIAFGSYIHIDFKNYRQAWLNALPDNTRNAFLGLENARKEAHWGVDEHGKQFLSDCRFNVTQLTDAIENTLLECAQVHGPGYVILGDSHANDLFGVVASRFEYPFIVSVSRGFCRPHTPLATCHYDRFLDFIRQNPEIFAHIIYEQAGFYLLKSRFGTPGSRDLFTHLPVDAPITDIVVDENHIALTYNYLAKLAEIVPVTWFGSRIEPHFTKSTILRLGCDYPYAFRKNQPELFTKMDEIIKQRIGATPNMRFISQNEVFAFQFPQDFTDCKVFYWNDGDHFSGIGEETFGARLPDDFLNFP